MTKWGCAQRCRDTLGSSDSREHTAGRNLIHTSSRSYDLLKTLWCRAQAKGISIVHCAVSINSRKWCAKDGVVLLTLLYVVKCYSYKYLKLGTTALVLLAASVFLHCCMHLDIDTAVVHDVAKMNHGSTRTLSSSPVCRYDRG